MKLASYSTEGKFEGFKELGKDFLFGGDYIELKENFMQRGDIRWTQTIDRDEKDPLNRFPDKKGKGRFDGRTFGNGRYVLEVNNEDFVMSQFYVPTGKKYFIKGRDEHYYPESVFVYEGSLHSNPELFSKL